MEYCSGIKELNNAICSNMGGPRDYYTKWNKSDRERQIYDVTYSWDLKNDTKGIIDKAETDSQTQEVYFQSAKGKWGEG